MKVPLYGRYGEASDYKNNDCNTILAKKFHLSTFNTHIECGGYNGRILKYRGYSLNISFLLLFFKMNTKMEKFAGFRMNVVC